MDYEYDEFDDDDDDGVIYDDEYGAAVQSLPRFEAIYICEDGHETAITLSTSAEVPLTWECIVCSKLGTLKDSDTQQKKLSTGKKSVAWDKLLERRTLPELKAMVDERMKKLRSGEEVRVIVG